MKSCEFLVFWVIFCVKNAENDYFDERLDCTAPKPWWKYTTTVRASALKSDYVLLDPGSNPHQVNLFIYLNSDEINKNNLIEE